jgi:hypothetical protein
VLILGWLTLLQNLVKVYKTQVETDDLLRTSYTDRVFHFEGQSFTPETTSLWQYLVDHISKEKEKHATRAKKVELDVLKDLDGLMGELDQLRYGLQMQYMREENYQTERKAMEEVRIK